jgi:carboxyl-terminal processing protease
MGAIPKASVWGGSALRPKHSFRLNLCLSILGLWILPLPLQMQASPLKEGKWKELLIQGENFERQGDWEKACQTYDAILQQDRNLAEIKVRYQHCLRRYRQGLRLRDPSYRKEVLSLDVGQAMRLFGIVSNTLLDNSLEKKKVTAGRLFHKGLEELNYALADPEFCQAHLPSAKPAEIKAFRTFLAKTWGGMPIANRQEAKKQVREVALAASAMLQLNPTTVIMEFTCGSCYAIDDYTSYLTPIQLRELCDSLAGETGGIGLILAMKEGKLVVADLQPFSPAAETILAKDDQIISLEKKASNQLTVELAHELLEGPIGSSVELVVHSQTMGVRSLTIRRRAMFTPSVNAFILEGTAIGYLQIACFQDTTLQELDVALLKLNKEGMKALILDLRGNGGGIFEVAIDAARRFLLTGVIASTQSNDPKFNTIYQSRNPAALTLPLVVMIDGDTASAAEVLAGALKENKRGRLVGQTSFGKGCTQTVLKLPPAPGGLPTGGLRLTVARFFSPTGQPYNGRGVTPHLFAERFLMADAMNDHQMEEARMEAQRLLTSTDR